jgi:hypothetical protein
LIRCNTKEKLTFPISTMDTGYIELHYGNNTSAYTFPS